MNYKGQKCLSGEGQTFFVSFLAGQTPLRLRLEGYTFSVGNGKDRLSLCIIVRTD